MFLDLNVSYSKDSVVNRRLVSTLMRLGFDGCAFSQEFVGKLTPQQTCKIQPVNVSGTDVPRLFASPLNLQAPFRQLTRVTVVIEDTNQLNLLSARQGAHNTYDIVAVRPTSEKAFSACCGSQDVDIISLDLSTRLPWNIRVPHLSQIAERGIFLEICISPAIRDVSARRQVISNALNLMRLARGRRILLSSGAAEAMELRGPYDIINLGNLIGLPHEKAKSALSTAADMVIKHAEARQTFKTAIRSINPQVSGSRHATSRVAPTAAASGSTPKSTGKRKDRDNDETR
mmetsp:Transcript_6405/g.10480  ORF Transcript_6405/g.10480 Transcript_6405/m.10480 type:complete len:288 (+) Transcript_6405:40-903(+)